ncbi:MAG TPA: FG-GAP-like repeat-containing protein [Polyangiaceae bacterium]|nr:FG-GAP-like repeat-containing protein [Polyangiaceae bacterium]
MTNINLKPLTCAVVLGILWGAGCGGTMNLTKQKGSAGSDSTLSGGENSMLLGGSGSMLPGGTGSTLAGGAGSAAMAGAANSGVGGRGADTLPGSVGGTGNRAGAGNFAGGANLLGVVSRNACDRDSSPCATDSAITCDARNTDSKNCGTCGNACSSGEICFAGVCASPPASCGVGAALTAPPVLASGQWTRTLVIGDWNRDSITDFAVANSNAATASVFLGCGSGTFAPRVDYVVTATQAAADFYDRAGLTSCDVNADGKADLVTAGSADPTRVTVLVGVGDGTFVLKGISGVTSSRAGMVCADLSNDGNADVALTSSGQKISILLGTGEGMLKASGAYSTNDNSSRLDVGDLNEDGRVDLVVSMYFGVQVLLGNGDGTFSALPEHSNGGYETIDFAIADLNGDGHLDLGVGDDQPRGVTKNGGVGIIAGHGDGTLGELLVTDSSSTDVLGVAAGDVNRDGKPDLVGAAQAGIRVLFGTGAGEVASPSSPGLSTTDRYMAAELGDLDGDGKLDLLGTKTSDSHIYLLLGNGDGTFRQ